MHVPQALAAALFLSALPAACSTQERAVPESAGIACPQLDEGLAAKIDGLVRRAMKDGPIAGLSLAVDRGGEVLLARGWGWAHLELEVPATEHTVYRIGSVTKQFTAAAVLQLEDEDALELDDPITDFLPDFPCHEHEVTLEHLLQHTSGIKSYTGLPDFWETAHLNLSHEAMIAQFAELPYDFAPGEKFLYNNSGFYLLGVVIEKVSERSYGDYLRDEFFEPLDMRSTCHGWNRPLLKNRASGYDVEDHELVNCKYMGMAAPGAAGALCSTVLDLVRWNRGLYTGGLISDEALAAMTTPGELDDGSALAYGYGLSIKDVVDRSMSDTDAKGYFHGGGIFGFSSLLLYLPDADLSVAVLTNTSGAGAGAVAQQVTRAFMADFELP